MEQENKYAYETLPEGGHLVAALPMNAVPGRCWRQIRSALPPS